MIKSEIEEARQQAEHFSKSKVIRMSDLWILNRKFLSETCFFLN